MTRRRDRADPVPLGDALAQVGAQLGVGPADTFALVVAAWGSVAGEPLAAHSRVRSLRDGLCTVEVDGPAWATRARYLETALVEAAGEAARGARGGPPVTSLRVVVAPGPAGVPGAPIW